VGLALAPGAGGWPWATFAVNVSGSFALAVLLALLLDATRPGRYLRPAAAIGFLGSFTTFAGWLVRVDRLAGDGRAGLAAAYLFASLAAGLAAVWLGLIAGRAMLRRRRGAS
jgi:CrcB protein